jgi:TPR repeat protein
MPPTRILLVLIVALLLLTAASSVKSTDKNSLQYDGVYQTQTSLTGQDQFLYLRFYPDGHVVAMASVWTPKKVASFISRSQPELPQGDYRLEGSKVMFTTKGQRGEVDYQGMINEKGILFHIHSRVTDFSSNQQFVFWAVQFSTSPEPLTNGLDETRHQAESGDAAAQVQLGDAYDTGAGVKRDVAEAIKWYRKAAEQGNAEGQYSLGGKYDSGDGVSQDYTEALKWYLKAAEQGHNIAQYNAGVLYYRALGTHQDFAEAAKWWHKAAIGGNANAQLSLAMLYYAGAGVLKDETEALAWFMVSAAAGNNEAATQRDWLVRDLDTEQKQLAQERSKKIAQEIELWRSVLTNDEKPKDAQK